MPGQPFATIRNGKIKHLEPIVLPEGTEIIIMINPRSESDKDEEWYALSLQGLSRAYSDDEPEYELSQIKEFNPDYEGR
jgi:predicted DNA-binding antitoxin AbrB/MazE fold protein